MQSSSDEDAAAHDVIGNLVKEGDGKVCLKNVIVLHYTTEDGSLLYRSIMLLVR